MTDIPAAKRPFPARRFAAVAVICLTALFVAGCGGCGDDGSDKPSAPEGVKVKESLVKKGDSAAADGYAEDYKPTGELIADSGFRPNKDGFAFENYGNDVGPVNMGPAQVEDLFGEDVCLSGSGDECELVPAAKEWMANQNDGMSGGHCQGFSVTALRMFEQNLNPADFGADRPFDLDIVDNEPLQSAIAEHFTYQFLPPIVEQRVKGTPSEVLDTLGQALNDDSEQYTLGIYKPDLTGGHAITPYAIEDKGNGKYAILVYDNNFPGGTRAVDVDTNDDTWHYVGGTNPSNTDEVYDGDASTRTMELDPTSPGEDYSPCPFCEAGAAGDDGSGKGAALKGDERYTEITLTGDPRNHPHLVFTDDDGNRTGLVDGKLLNEIPDIEVVKTYATQNWEGAPEPRYRLPEGANYSITVDGSKLEKPAKPSINLVGNGLVIDIEDITIKPGQKDEMALPGGYGITYQSNSDEEIAPNIFAGLEEDDAAYNFAASAVGLAKGSTISLLVEQEEKVVILDSTGGEGVDGADPIYILQLTKADADGNIFQWQNPQVELDGSQEEKAGFEYGESPTPHKPLPLVLLDKNGDPTDTIEADPQ